MRLRLPLTLLALTAVAPVVLATPAQAACVTSTRTVSGTIAGQDGRYVDALLGLDLLDSAGRHVDARPGVSTFGCTGRSGYGLSIRVNSSLPSTGSTSSGTKSWTAQVPTNVVAMHIEAYPQNAGAGGTDESRYGHALRRKVRIPYPVRINVRLPVICAAGGQTGAINGWVSKGGVRVKADRVAAWSLGADNNTPSPLLGWNIGYAKDNGYYLIPNLASGQTYTVQVRKDGKLIQKYNIAVNACKSTYMGAAFA